MDEFQEVCSVCAKPSEAKCSRCQAVDYCGQECQRRDWKQHKLVCRKLAASASTPAPAVAVETKLASARATGAAPVASATGYYVQPAAAPVAAAPEAAQVTASRPEKADSLIPESRGAPRVGIKPVKSAEVMPMQNSWSGSPGDPAPFDVTLSGSRSVENAQKVVDVLKERGVCVIKASAEKQFQRACFVESKLLWETNGFMDAKKGKPEHVGSDSIRFDSRDDKVAWFTKAFVAEHERNIKALKVLDSQLQDFGFGIAKLLEEQLGLTITTRTPAMLACYAGDAVDQPRYDYHMDNPYQTNMQVPDDKRRLTLLYYVSDGPWDVHKDGGALQVALSNPRRPPKTTAEALQHDKITIAPESDTLVLFFSHTMYHAVLPVTSKTRRRFAMSTWFNTT